MLQEMSMNHLWDGKCNTSHSLSAVRFTNSSFMLIFYKIYIEISLYEI
jgi:hypothetical protein